MAQTQANIASLDPVWTTIRREAEQVARDEPLMASLVHAGHPAPRAASSGR